MAEHDTYFYSMRAKRILLHLINHHLYKYLPQSLFTNQFPGINGKIHTLDFMLEPLSQKGLKHYTSVGLSAIYNIDESLKAANLTYNSINACLDLPCGHGRVLRWLIKRINPTRITACEIDTMAADFCQSEFGAKALYSSDDPEQIPFQEEYDLIWVGSLFTHLDADRSLALLKRLVEVTKAGGVLIFTTQGESCLTDPGLPGYNKRFVPMENKLKEDFYKNGYCYAPYEDNGNYGAALYAEDYIRNLMSEHFSDDMKLVRFKTRGWDNHQDVWSYKKDR